MRWKVNKPDIQSIFVGTVTVILIIRFLLFIVQNSVNVLFWDQWDILRPLFAGKGDIWAMFSLQHGPHRQGLGGILLGIIYPLSAWNVRVEVFISGIIIAIGCGLALLVKRKAFSPLIWSDIAIPLVYFTLLQYENFVITPNPAHGPIPVLLISAIAYCLLIEKPVIKASSIALLTFFTTYTGFAIFSGVIIIPLLLIQAWKNTIASDRLAYLGASGFCVLSFAAFLMGYQNQPAVDCFKFPHDQPLQYLEFMAKFLGRSVGLFYQGKQNSILHLNLAYCLLAVLAIAALISSIQLIFKATPQPQNELIFYLASFTLFFALFSAFGRVCLGTDSAMSSRYMPYSIPGLLAIYFSCLSLAANISTSSFIRNRAIGLMISTTLITSFVVIATTKEISVLNDSGSQNDIKGFRNGKLAWSDCYVKNADIAICDQQTKFSLYPASIQIQDRLQFLKKNNLNFFRQ